MRCRGRPNCCEPRTEALRYDRQKGHICDVAVDPRNAFQEGMAPEVLKNLLVARRNVCN